MIAGTYKGGNVTEIIASRAFSACGDELGHVTIMATMTELRELMDKLEAAYREQSCCPSCGVLTLDGSTCADCLRYEATACECGGSGLIMVVLPCECCTDYEPCPICNAAER